MVAVCLPNLYEANSTERGGGGNKERELERRKGEEEEEGRGREITEKREGATRGGEDSVLEL